MFNKNESFVAFFTDLLPTSRPFPDPLQFHPGKHCPTLTEQGSGPSVSLQHHQSRHWQQGHEAAQSSAEAALHTRLGFGVAGGFSSFFAGFREILIKAWGKLESVRLCCAKQ